MGNIGRSERIAALAALGLLLATVASCDQGGSASNTITTDDEVAALNIPQFTQPVMLHITNDTYVAAQAAAAMHGVSPVYPPEEHTTGINLRPCRGSDDEYNYPTPFAFTAYLSAFTYLGGAALPQEEAVERWLIAKGIVDLQQYPIRHSMPEDTDYDKVSTYVCPVVSESIRPFLPEEQRASNIHNGLVFPLLQRKFVTWTYRNRYDTPVSGQGTVKAFAGTFSYTFTSAIPGVLVHGLGTASVKLMLNPDTGRWEGAGSFQDPSITLQ